MHIEFHNIKNVLVQRTKKVPIIWKYGHLFMLLGRFKTTLTYTYTTMSDVAECHLTDVELRQLH